MTHPEFRDLCRKFGIYISSITDKTIELSATITAQIIDFDLFDPERPEDTVRNLLRQGKKVWMGKMKPSPVKG